MLQISKCHSVFALGAYETPALKVSSGSEVIFETHDCFQSQIHKENQSIDQLDWNRINPATGPLYIENAKPGHVLKVEILSITIDQQGVMAAIPGAGLLGDSVTKSEIKIIPIENNIAQFNEKLNLPVTPSIGVIGVAAKNEPVPCGVPGEHGGNMDNKKIRAGSTLYLPVFVEGALLSIGDLHALIGDGEIMVSGLEVGGRVSVRVTVEETFSLTHPFLEDETHYYTIASHKDLLQAVKISTESMHQMLMTKTGMTFNEAGMLLSVAGNTEICQVVDPLLTARYALPKKVFQSLMES
ncbi:amidase [Tindallia magadiensis]|uniref:Amidase n=1 Tax=Tindallia magadiensis TaxID=69895 RepID=A0A1I3DVG9_9FIRM|nr:acetamidase/formamidase family protein [Tindallia magadiensis]SFH90732.1 amidase [Tindallia magadiensis]